MQHAKSTSTDRLTAVIAIVFGLALVAGCGGSAGRGDKAQIAGEPSYGAAVQIAGGEGPRRVADLDQDLYLGLAIHVENLTVWPVYTKHPIAAIDGDFITLAQAQDGGYAVVREIGAVVQVAGNALPHLGEVSGSVNELVIENRGGQPILVLAGTLLKGGKQDRQVGQDFVVPPGKTVAVDAFCVEQGRWTAQREGAATQGIFEAQQALATAAVRASGQYKGDQSEVWRNVAQANSAAGKAPSSGTLFATIENAEQSSVARRQRLRRAVTEGFVGPLRQEVAPVGLAYAVDGQVREVRAFTHPRIFERFFDTLVGTVVLEGDLAQQAALRSGAAIYDRAAAPAQVTDLVSDASKVAAEKHRTKAGNVNRLRKSKKVWNSDCYADEEQDAPVTRSFMYAH
jgi:hypothetical protein